MEETQASRIVKGSPYIVTQNLVVTVVGALGFVFIARILTQTEMGVIVALTLAMVIARSYRTLGLAVD